MHGHHHHHHHGDGSKGDGRLVVALAVNALLSAVQIVGGIFAGSLSLIADALHNFSDAFALAIAYFARRIARRPSDSDMTFGYVRAEAVAALMNYTTLIVIGIYLVYEAVMRFIRPEPVEGWIIVWIAAVALVVDVATAVLTYTMSRESMNIRAAFLHNVADALGSVGVIVAGTLILLFDWRLADPVVTLMIAGYILWQAFAEIGGSIRLLMLGSPPEIDVEELVAALRALPDVDDVHHVHVWMIDEHQYALEAHVVVADGIADAADGIRQRIRRLADEHFDITHATLEIEHASLACRGDQAQVIGHRLRRQPPR